MENALAGLYDGARLSQGFQDTFDNSRLNRLAGEAYSAPRDQRQSILGQMASIDPQAAQEQQQQFQADEDRQTKLLVNGARYMKGALDSKNPSAVAGAWRTVRPSLIRAGLATEQELSPDWDPSYEATVHQLLAMGEGSAGSTPTDVRSFQMMTQGLSPEDREKARRINLGLDGKASGAALKYEWVTGPDGTPVLQALDPNSPTASTVTYGGGSSAATAPQAAGQQHFGNFTALAGEFPGVAMTSGMRTQKRNEEVGGQANSQHLTGTAADYAVPPQLKPAFIARAKQMGYQAIDEGDHIHLQLPRGGVSPLGGQPVTQRSKEAEAAAVEAAKQRVQLDYLPQQQAIETQGAIDRAVGTERGKAQVEREAAAPKRIKQYEQSLAASKSVRDALDRAIDLIGPTTTGWVGARMRNIEGSDAFDLASQIETVKANLGFDRLQQMRDNSPTGGALGAIAVQELVALQSTIANLDPNQSDGQLKANLQKVQQHYKNWEAAVQQALADEKRSGGGAAPAAGQRTIVRTGTSNGRKVIQYSDGSVEYGN